VRAGIQTVTRLLERRGDGTRGLYVDPCCVHTLAEYAAYQYPPDAGAAEHGALADALAPGMRGLGTALSELLLKANDHALDATRYALHTHLRASRAAATWMQTWLARRPDDSPQSTQSIQRPE
jgi:hypothetical protein